MRKSREGGPVRVVMPLSDTELSALCLIAARENVGLALLAMGREVRNLQSPALDRIEGELKRRGIDLEEKRVPIGNPVAVKRQERRDG